MSLDTILIIGMSCVFVWLIKGMVGIEVGFSMWLDRAAKKRMKNKLCRIGLNETADYKSVCIYPKWKIWIGDFEIWKLQ